MEVLAFRAQLAWRLQRMQIQPSSMRNNVLPSGVREVESLTLGITRNRRQCGTWYIPTSTYANKELLTHLLAWAGWTLQQLGVRLPVTAITINRGFASRTHRDASNLGPSLISTFGQYEGGNLMYWPEDDASAHVNTLPCAAAVEIDTHCHGILFDGRRAHATTGYTGTRMSVVFWCPSDFVSVPRNVWSELKALGFQVPEKQPTQAHLSTPPLNGHEAHRKLQARHI